MDGKEVLLQSSDVAVVICDEVKANAQKRGFQLVTNRDGKIDDGAGSTINSEVCVKLSAGTINDLTILAAVINDCQTDLHFACSKKKSPLPIFAKVLHRVCELKEGVELLLHKSTMVIAPAVSNSQSTSSTSSTLNLLNAVNADVHCKLQRLQLEMDKWQATCASYKYDYFRNTTDAATRIKNDDGRRLLTAVEAMQAEIDTTFTALKKLFANVPKDPATLRAEENRKNEAHCKLFLVQIVILAVIIAALLIFAF